MATQQSIDSLKGVPIPQSEQKEIEQLYATLRQMEAKLIGPDGKAEILPSNINSFLFGLLRDLKAGYSVTILQNKGQLTTVEASKLLGMSRQFLVRLLDKGEIPFHKVGTHRRIFARDVLSYKKQRETNRRKALVDLARAEHKEGLYSVPDDFNTGQ
jgi:excisionase family DNA binding protein